MVVLFSLKNLEIFLYILWFLENLFLYVSNLPTKMMKNYENLNLEILTNKGIIFILLFQYFFSLFKISKKNGFNKKIWENTLKKFLKNKGGKIVFLLFCSSKSLYLVFGSRSFFVALWFLKFYYQNI